MRRWIAFLLLCSPALVGCDRPPASPPPAKANGSPGGGVKVNTDDVDVNVKKDQGVGVHAPDVNVEVKKK